MFGLWIIVLLGFVKASYQTTYTCDPDAVSCGCSMNSAVVNRIVNGENASESTWSWAVSIYINTNSSIGNICGGTILTDSWILTAAHCLEDVETSQVIVYAGSIVRFEGTQILLASQFIVHPDYNNETWENDIGLIQLSSPINTNDSEVQKICLPSVGLELIEGFQWPIPGTTVVAIGWGSLYENGPMSATLQQVTLQILDNDESSCIELLESPLTQVCASVPNNTKDTCEGDDGGPLMMFSSNKQWILIGLNSWGAGCARLGSSGMYTRIAPYKSWINSYVNDSVWISDPSPLITESTSAILFDSSTTFPPIELHTNTVGISIYYVLGVVLFEFLLAVYF